MEKEQTYEVYKITNNINGLVYIGCTTNGCSFRFHRHLLKAKDGESNYPLHKAIREFGENNFSVSLLEFCNDEKEMQEREIFYIANFESTNPEKGYNVRKGGGVHFHNEEAKTKISNIHRGKVSDKRRPVLQYSKDGEYLQEFESLSAAEEITGITRASILKSIKKILKKPTPKNPYIWIYRDTVTIVPSEVNPEDHYQDLNFKPKMSQACIEARGNFQTKDGNVLSLSKQVAKYENGIQVKVFDSMTQASKECGVSVRTIKTHIDKNIGDWKYIEANRSEEELKELMKANALKAARLQGVSIIAVNSVTKEVKEFDTLSDAAKFAGGADRKTLKYHINNQDIWRGYIWKYKE